MTTLSKAAFKFSSDRNSVIVENISECVSRREIVALFNTLIGEVRNSQTVQDGSGSRLEISFHTVESSKKALCMSGYIIGGLPLVVTASRPSDEFQSKEKRSETRETRRNLYVLGLPFALTKTEFAGIFSRYGTVSHCVILATVDNAQRRRGFVVMSSPDEAKVAMASLSRTQIKDHTLDISWAVVQRSQGFLDGGDRTMMIESSSPTPSHDIVQHDKFSYDSSQHDQSGRSTNSGQDLFCLATSLVPTSSLLVTNLPTLLFSQTVDLHPLFYPFGQIKRLDILSSPPASGLVDKMSVIVEYATFREAQDAKESLQGQCYANYTLNVDFLQTKPQAELGPGVPAHTSSFNTYSENINVSNLNPFAPPFVLEAPQPGIFVGSFASDRDIPMRNYFNDHTDPQCSPLYAPPHLFSYANFRLPTSRMVSRSSSTTSRK